MDNQKFSNTILDKVSNAIPTALAFLVPIFFLSTTTEFFSFNKLTLIAISTLLLVVLWAVKILTGKKVDFTKSAVDLPLFGLTLIMALSTVFSLNKSISIFGNQGRWLGLFSWLIMMVYYYLSTPLLTTKKAIKNTIYAFTAGATAGTVVALLSYYNIYIVATNYGKLPTFTLAGSITNGVLLAALGLTASLGLIAYEKNQLIKYALMFVSVINFYYIAIIGSLVGWAVAITGLIGLLVFVDSEKLSQEKVKYMTLAGTTLALLALIIVPTTKGILVKADYPRELKLPLRESWLISSSIVQEYPILATGPSTFALNFTRYRPVSLNATDTWSVTFDKPYNEIFNILGTLGLVGFVAAIYLATKMYKLISVSRIIRDEDGLNSILSILSLGVLVSFLFTHATIISTFMMFFFLGLLVASYKRSDHAFKITETVSFGATNVSSISGLGEASVVTTEYIRYIIAVPIFLAVAYVGFLGYRVYAGEYYMRKSIVAAQANDGTNTYEFQRKAINANPNNDMYHAAYAQTNLALANSLASKGESLTEGEKETIQGLISQAIQSARVSTEVVNPLNAANWETRALIYRSINGVAENAGDWALQAYNTAIQLDPTNPRLRLDLGGVYYAAEDYLSAANQFRQATALKPDYANAYYNFAQALIKLEDYKNAMAALEATKSLVPQDSEDYKLLDEEIKTLAKNPAVAGTAATKPTVEELTRTPETVTENQEPLTNAGQEQQLSGENLDLGTLPQPENPVRAPEEVKVEENK